MRSFLRFLLLAMAYAAASTAHAQKDHPKGKAFYCVRCGAEPDVSFGSCKDCTGKIGGEGGGVLCGIKTCKFLKHKITLGRCKDQRNASFCDR